MATIGLYDIDFHHSKSTIPNLELMKTFNYFYQKGDQVIFLEPKENFERCNKIFFFKESPNLKVPKSLNLLGTNKQIYGYGFYRSFTPLKSPVNECAPSFIPYDLKENKIKNLKEYKKIKKSSLIRIENNDFTGFNSSSNTIYLADHDFFYQNNAEAFLKEYHKNYYIKFLRGLMAKDEETFLKFFPYCTLSGRKVGIDFDFSLDFFKKYYYEEVQFYFFKDKNKDFCQELEKVIRLLLFVKKENRIVSFFFNEPTKTEKEKQPLYLLLPLIKKWGENKEQISFYDYMKKNNQEKLFIELLYNKTDLRLLLKTQPLNFCE